MFYDEEHDEEYQGDDSLYNSSDFDGNEYGGDEYTNQFGDGDDEDDPLGESADHFQRNRKESDLENQSKAYQQQRDEKFLKRMGGKFSGRHDRENQEAQRKDSMKPTPENLIKCWDKIVASKRNKVHLAQLKPLVQAALLTLPPTPWTKKGWMILRPISYHIDPMGALVNVAKESVFSFFGVYCIKFLMTTNKAITEIVRQLLINANPRITQKGLIFKTQHAEYG